MPDIDVSRLSPQALQELAALALKVGNNPKTRRQYMKLLKEVDPDKYEDFPDQRVEDRIEAMNDQLEKDRIDRESEKHRVRMEAARHALTSRYDEEQIKKIEGVMERHGIADYEIGAKVYAHDTPALDPSNPNPAPSNTWELPKFDDYLKDPAKTARTIAGDMINQFNATRRPQR